ncbi:hypothetical protein INT45_009302 [Circinella minor]|uniref:Uncharacterized protein n=1 Tax=Circinella minor TaxID=1195481 RepID=A0A8H7V1M5_9FUNG|nr:hypothetical protein INT45_009302 [Circinella minor]
MSERIVTLGAKFLNRLSYLPDDALITMLKPFFTNKRFHQLPKLQQNKLWLSLPEPRDSLPSGALKKAISDMRQQHHIQNCNASKGNILISACRLQIGVDPILWLPMTARERSRLIRWRMGWLPGKPQRCSNCSNTCTSRHHLIDCLDVASVLGVDPSCKPNPIDFLLNRLPRRQPSPRSIIADPYPAVIYWSKHWPVLAQLMLDIDTICHPEEDFTTSQTDPELGQQFLQWLDNRISPSPPPPDSNTISAISNSNDSNFHHFDDLNNSDSNIPSNSSIADPLVTLASG